MTRTDLPAENHKAPQHFYAHLSRGLIRRAEFSIIDGEEMATLLYVSRYDLYNNRFCTLIKATDVDPIAAKLIDRQVPTLRLYWPATGLSPEDEAPCYRVLCTPSGELLAESTSPRFDEILDLHYYRKSNYSDRFLP